MDVKVEHIGVIRSCFTEKFGIPRQPGMVKSALATLELIPPFNREEMVRGLEDFSHIWVHFVFHETVGEGWKNTVRPPWLGGKKRVGVFACRSPHRPNHLGLSVVKLEAVCCDGKGCRLELSGVDFLDQTPVIDIKPYVPYSDCIKTASGGYATGEVPDVEVIFSKQVLGFCEEYKGDTGRNVQRLIEEMIRQDPRPAIQKKEKSGFGMLLWDVNIRWSVKGGVFLVESCEKI
jgi:tRNA-Thr(GGU) m(6)t(6)A37 methyltransferase TsaA